MSSPSVTRSPTTAGSGGRAARSSSSAPARGLVDDAIINKKKRGFFRAGLSAWTSANRDDLLDDVLLDSRARERGLFDPAAVSGLVAAAGSDGTKADQRLFCMFLLEMWSRFYVDADGAGRRVPAQSAS